MLAQAAEQFHEKMPWTIHGQLPHCLLAVGAAALNLWNDASLYPQPVSVTIQLHLF